MQFINQDLFDKLSDPMSEISLCAAETEDSKFNCCLDCDVRMDLVGSEYKCPQCGYTSENDPDRGKELDDISSNSIRVTTGANKGRYRNGNTNYANVQKKNLIDQLNTRQDQYQGPKFSKDVLGAAATQYNNSQKYIKQVLDDQGEKKFVRRGSIKDEILAALIYFEGVRVKNVRKRKDVAIFMGLATCGFARGEDIVRTWQAKGLIDIPVNDEPLEGYIDRYMETLGLDDPNYNAFVAEIVQLSEDRKIAMGSQISSKVVGAIWVLITQLGKKITAATLETATDNTKKNTFTKFSKIIMESRNVFAAIFRKYNIPL